MLSQEKKVQPLLLLDDIFAKLDQTRVEHLLKLLKKEHFGQLFLTDTDPQRVDQLLDRLEMDASRFIIQEGTIIKHGT